VKIYANVPARGPNSEIFSHKTIDISDASIVLLSIQLVSIEFY